MVGKKFGEEAEQVARQFIERMAPQQAAGSDELDERQGQDYVDRDEKLKRAGAKELGMMDKLKNIPRGMKAMAKGEPEDDVSLYNKSKATKEDILDIKRLAGL